MALPRLNYCINFPKENYLHPSKHVSMFFFFILRWLSNISTFFCLFVLLMSPSHSSPLPSQHLNKMVCWIDSVLFHQVTAQNKIWFVPDTFFLNSMISLNSNVSGFRAFCFMQPLGKITLNEFNKIYSSVDYKPSVSQYDSLTHRHACVHTHTQGQSVVLIISSFCVTFQLYNLRGMQNQRLHCL